MTDGPETLANETPMQRALRMKNAARESKPKAPGAALHRDQAGIAAGASKPWTKK